MSIRLRGSALLLCLTVASGVSAQSQAAVCDDSTATLAQQADACLAVAEAQPKDGAALRRAGAALRVADRHEESIEQYRKAIKVDARDAVARHGLGHALSDVDRDDEALREFRAALALTPDELEIWTDILWLLAYLDRTDTVALEVASLRRATPDSAAALKDAGDAVYSAELYAEALPFFERALVLDSATWVHHTDVAYTLSQLDRLDDATRAFERGLRHFSKDTAARTEFARFLYRAGNAEAAAAQFDTIARIAAYDPIPLRYRGDILSEIGQHDAAIAAYREAVTRDPTQGDSHYDLASGLLAAGQAGDAANEFRIAIRLDSSNAVFHNDLGVALEQAGHLDSARTAYGRAAALDESVPLFHVNYTFSTLRLGFPDEAKSIVGQWIADDTLDATRELLRAQLLLELQDADSAIVSATRALGLDSTLTEAFVALSISHMLNEDANAADAVLARGLAQDSTLAQLWAIRGLLHTAQEHHAQAMEYWQRVIQLEPRMLDAPELRNAYEQSRAATDSGSAGDANPPDAEREF